MFGILLDKQFWSTVVYSSANKLIAAGIIVQTIIFTLTFKYGFQYLVQHKKKVKIGKNVELSQKIIYNLYRMNGIGESIFENITFLSAKDSNNANQTSDIPDEFNDHNYQIILFVI